MFRKSRVRPRVAMELGNAEAIAVMRRRDKSAAPALDGVLAALGRAATG